MPERKHKLYQRVESDEVQGEGSYVVLRSLTLEKAKELYGTAKGADQSDDSQMLTLGIEILKDLILEWNWVDDDGKPLPQPQDDPKVLDGLPYQEAAFLVSQLGLGEAHVKN